MINLSYFLMSVGYNNIMLKFVGIGTLDGEQDDGRFWSEG